MSTSVGLNVNGGRNIDASFIAFSIGLGGLGLSADAPVAITKSPLCVRNSVAIFARKNSKSCVDALFGFGVLTTTAPVPSNCLAEKSRSFQ